VIRPRLEPLEGEPFFKVVLRLVYAPGGAETRAKKPTKVANLGVQAYAARL
jgi:hypothetical protein